MSYEIIDRLHQIQQHALALQAAVSAAQSQAGPREGRGVDPTDSVEVVVAPDGLPCRIEVRAGWQRQVFPEDLGNAVMRAFEQAVAEESRAVSDSFDLSGWRSKVRCIEAASRESPSRATPLQQVEPCAGPRNPLYLTEDVLKALKDARAESVAPAARWIGWDGGRAVSVTLGFGGMSACTINPRWVAKRPAAEVNRALAGALKASRELMEQQAVRRRGESKRLEALAHEALATLVTMQNPTEPREER